MVEVARSVGKQTPVEMERLETGKKSGSPRKEGVG